MKKEKKNYVAVGGQALMEGIMMNGPKGRSIALRLPDGSIEVTMREFSQLKDKYKICRVPIIRGIVGFVETLIFGYQCLMYSAEKTTLDTGDEEEELSKFDKWVLDHFGEKMMAFIGGVSAVLGLLLAFALFVWMPSFLFDLTNNYIAHGAMAGFRAIFEGVIRIVIFVSYMYAVSKMKDIKRVFMYHGAEHKSIFCFESGEPMTVANVRKQIRFHPRCGTSFVFVIIILSILLSSIIGVTFPVLTTIRPLWILIKLLIMPLVMGIGYEFIRYAGCHDNLFVKILSAPGLWMQRITTAEPTDDMIEVGIAAIMAVIENPEERMDPEEKKKLEAQKENEEVKDSEEVEVIEEVIDVEEITSQENE